MNEYKITLRTANDVFYIVINAESFEKAVEWLSDFFGFDMNDHITGYYCELGF